MKKYFSLLFITCFTTITYSQNYIGQKSFAGVSVGTLTYTGIYSKNTSLVSHTSMAATAFYGHRLVIPRQLFIKAELMMGEIAGSNVRTVAPESPIKGGFRCYVLEGSVKGEYDLMDLYRHKISPYINGGAGVYYLFDYESKQGVEKTGRESWGAIMPVGAGVKYRLNKRIKIFCEGSYRFFAGNFDNFPDETVSNPNRYYTIALGASVALQKFNRLW